MESVQSSVPLMYRASSVLLVSAARGSLIWESYTVDDGLTLFELM